VKRFFDQFPDADQLLSLKPENVVPALMRLALGRGPGTMFLPKTLTEVSSVDANVGRDYPPHRRGDVARFLERAWRLAESNGLVEPVPDQNGHNGWKYLTEDGAALARDQSIIPVPHVEKPAQEEWIGAADALALLKGRIGEGSATRAICKRAHAGLVKARAMRFIRDGLVTDNADVPAEMWWADGGAALAQNWASGDFETWINQHIRLQAYGVTFRRSDILSLLPAQPGAPPPAAVAKGEGGRPKARWSDDLWIEMCRQLYEGDLKPKKQSDIKRAMMDWLSTHGEEPAESTIKDRARKLWAVIGKDEN
jgi:hypothetical protein